MDSGSLLPVTEIRSDTPATVGKANELKRHRITAEVTILRPCRSLIAQRISCWSTRTEVLLAHAEFVNLRRSSRSTLES